MTDLILRSRRVLTPRGCVAAGVYVRDGYIERVTDFDELTAGVEVVDCGSHVVMPGLIDAQVRVDVPADEADELAALVGATTRAAAAGGVTTMVVAPPAGSAGARSGATLLDQQRGMRDHLQVDVGFWGAVTTDNLAQLTALERAGVLGFQCVLSPAGAPQSERISPPALEAIVAGVGELGALLVCQAELGWALDGAHSVWAHGDPTHYALYLAAHPPGAEVQAVALLSEWSARYHTRLHLAQVSSARVLGFVASARTRGVALSVGTSPHYLSLSSDSIRNGATQFKCAPPIRSRANRDKLWRGLAAGDIDLVSSNHMPRGGQPAPAHRRFDEAAHGIASLQLLLPVVWSAARARGHSLEDLSRWLTQAPAKLCGLGGARGQIAPGFRADLVVWDPEAQFVVDAQALQPCHQQTPYHGCQLFGAVHTTFLAGQAVYQREGESQRFSPPAGQLLRHDPAPART